MNLSGVVDVQDGVADGVGVEDEVEAAKNGTAIDSEVQVEMIISDMAPSTMRVE
jgi:hypothetical protein